MLDELDDKDKPEVLDWTAECAHCGEPLRSCDQRESGFCSSACRLAFLAEAESRLAEMLAEVAL